MRGQTKASFSERQEIIDYYLLDLCLHCFAPEFQDRGDRRFRDKICNKEYSQAAPELIDIRPANCAEFPNRIFGKFKEHITHLDYGGGLGTMRQLLRQDGRNSVPHAPFFLSTDDSASIQFDLVTAIEVFEHVPHPYKLMQQLLENLKSDGLLHFFQHYHQTQYCNKMHC